MQAHTNTIANIDSASFEETTLRNFQAPEDSGIWRMTPAGLVRQTSTAEVVKQLYKDESPSLVDRFRRWLRN